MNLHAEAVDRIRDRLKNRCGRITWTIETGRGETYRNRNWTIYAHDNYPRSSVLSGRERRTHIMEFGPGDEGKQAAIAACQEAGVWKYTEVLGGSTHVPVDQIVSHLPDDTDY